MRRWGLRTLATAAERERERELRLLPAAVRAFRERHGHVAVPYRFSVPAEPAAGWPAELRGLRLSAALRRFAAAASDLSDDEAHARAETEADAERRRELRRTREELSAAGLPAVDDWRRFHWQQLALAALRAYAALEGDLLVPRKFVVPTGDERWPRATWGLALGSHVNALRSRRPSLEPYQVEDLDRIGFVWSVLEHKWTSRFMPALRVYRTLHGHVHIPQAFTVPSDGDPGAIDWPSELRGFRLGAMVNHIRSSTGYHELVTQYSSELAQLGFSFSANDTTWNDKIMPALQTFREVFGHCSVDVYFVIPSSAPWPSNVWGMRLGFIAQNIRGRGDYVDQVIRDSAKLEALGFTWNVTEAKWRRVILPSLTMFVEQFGHTNIDPEFVVPASSPWPEAAWGFKLGGFAALPDLRLRFADYIEIDLGQLETLGFASWGTSSISDTEEEVREYQ